MKILLFFLVPLFFSAQTHRFIYEFSLKDDSTQTEKRKVNMVLDINPEEVKFYEYDYVLNDSLNKTQGRNSTIWNDTPAIFRKINTNHNSSFILINNLFVLETDDLVTWKLHNETKEKGGYLLQKATTNFGGRNWVAWFTKEISISEGPYKFRGLPGLIFEIYDTKDNFSFSLIKSYKLGKTFSTLSIIENFGGQKPVKITEKMLKKMRLDHFSDPLHEFKEQYKNNTDHTARFMVMGIEVKSLDQFKDLSENMQNHIRKMNNPIELDKIIVYPNK